ncbi:ribosome assembly protein METTL17, mitochondrial isoform X2 [Periplaneta americana]|uniref:ribosome assembly protein METTL17, mitochondrial isoform X2 n=1 Tax=Periplaneta americana TaxID=6978 RepID=UPI0037E8BAFC
MFYSCHLFYKWSYATKHKVGVQMELELISQFESNRLKPRKHPGAMKTSTAEVPAVAVKAMQSVMKDKPTKALSTEGAALVRYLRARLPPLEEREIRVRKKEIQRQVEKKYGIDASSLSEQEQAELHLKYKDEVVKRLQPTLSSWKSIEYDEHRALQYMVARFAPEFAALRRIFMEMKTRQPDFKPRTMFDFGSGVGTATWAARSVWTECMQEHFNVDSSGHMNDLASLLLREGNEDKEMPIKGVFYRQFLPASQLLQYDIVVSAYTLLELPSAVSRLETIVNLWNKTNRYLVLVEHGTNAGFKVTNEARDFILQLVKEGDAPTAHVLSPCPHDLPCPRFASDTTPCNFEVPYIPLPFEGTSDMGKERFSYVVLKKGARAADDKQWPRIVRPPLIRKKHTVCRMCVAGGKLQEIVFTASKHGKFPYRCARSSNWGDLLPLAISEDKAEDQKKEVEHEDQKNES